MSIDFPIPVSQETLTAVARLDRFRGRWATISGLPAKRSARIREAATVRSVAASCRLSGMPVSDQDVVAVLRDGSSSVQDAIAIRGYAAGLAFPFPGAERFVEAETLLSLNRTILQREETDEDRPWREQEMNREAFDSNGRALGWVFPTLPPRMVGSATDDLLTWLEFELRKGDRHPLTVIGVFILGFLAVSPFEHGNGRTSRALIVHLLVRAGYGHLPFGSIETELECRRSEYLEALFQARTGLWSGEADVQPWLTFFLDSLDRHRERVEAKLALEEGALEFPPLQREILEAVREHGTVNAALLIKATGANRNTLKDNLRRLVNRGVLEMTGRKRGTRYRLAGLEGPVTRTTE